MQFEIQTARNVACMFFLVLTIVLVTYVTILLFDKVTIIGKVFGQLPAFADTVPISVKIIHPDAQTTSVGNSIEISGESSYDPGYSCHVSVIINDIKPYQKTKPLGVRVENDYSTWKYTINSSYTTLREGDNRITARLLCSDEQGKDVRKWYSVNIIGQTATENSQAKGETISIPTSTESKSGLSKTTIGIDRNVFIDLINDRIGNNTDAIRDTIGDAIMYVYTGAR